MNLPIIVLKAIFWCSLCLATLLFLIEAPDLGSSGVTLPHVDKLVHLLCFVYLTWAFSIAYPHYRSLSYCIVLLGTYGLIIEILQHFLSYRSASILDWLADILGVLAVTLFKR